MRRAPPAKFGLLVVCCRGVACTGRRRLRPGGVHLRRRCTGICSSRSGRRILAVGGPGTPSSAPPAPAPPAPAPPAPAPPAPAPPAPPAANNDETGAAARASAKAKAHVLFSITLPPCAAHWHDDKASTPGGVGLWLSPSMLHIDLSTRVAACLTYRSHLAASHATNTP